MRIVISILFLYSVLTAEYDNLLLQAQASIFPKIIMLDQDVSKKLVNDKIELAIIHEKNDKAVADSLRQMIEETFKGKLGSFDFSISAVSAEDSAETATAYMLLQLTDSSIQKVVNTAQSHQRICFAYDYSKFDNSALISLLLKEKTYIYLNKKALSSYNINFKSLFYKIVKIIE